MNDQPAPAPGAPESQWILVVDDDKVMLELIALVLKTEGWTIETALSGKAAMAKIEEARMPPAVLVCDVIMDGMDGLELTRRLLNQVPGLKAIIVSAHFNEMSYWPEDLQSCPFIPKPFHQEELVNAVRKALAE